MPQRDIFLKSVSDAVTGGDPRTSHMHFFVIYNGLMDTAMTCLVVFMLGALFLAFKPTPKKDRPADWP